MNDLDFGDISGSEKAMQRTWDELRRDLSIGKLNAEDTNSALQYTFLNVFNDIFVVNNGQRYCKRWLEEFEERGESFFVVQEFPRTGCRHMIDLFRKKNLLLKIIGLVRQA